MSATILGLWKMLNCRDEKCGIEMRDRGLGYETEPPDHQTVGHEVTDAKPSPRSENAIPVSTMANPGKTASHQAVVI